MAGGSTVCLRDVNHGQVVFAWPLVIVEDTPSFLLAAQLDGAVGMVPDGYPHDPRRLVEQASAREWLLVERPWQSTNCLHVFETGTWWSTRLMWDADTGKFMCWYVDFRLPVTRTDGRVDSKDLQLDVVMSPDGSWTWKDETHFALAVKAGFIHEDQRAAVEAARGQVVARIERREFPFDDSLVDWTPDGLSVPTLPADWHVV